MIGYAAQSGKLTYKLNHYVVDTNSEMQEILTAGADSRYSKASIMGSTITVIETGDTYILNSKKAWIKQPAASSSSGGGSSSDESDITVLDGSTSADDDDDDIVIL